MLSLLDSTATGESDPNTAAVDTTMQDMGIDGLKAIESLAGLTLDMESKHNSLLV